MEGNDKNRTVHHSDVAHSLPPIVAVLGATQSALAPIKHRYSFPRIAVSRLPESACMRLDRRVHVAHQIRISRSSPTGVPEELREPGPGVDLDQDFRQLHPWQELKRARESYDRSGAGKTSLSVRNRSRARRKRTFGASIVLKGPFEPAKLRVLPSPVTGASRSRGVPEPR